MTAKAYDIAKLGIKSFLLFSLILMQSNLRAQLNNNGATIRINSGSSIVCIGNVNNVSGTITNDGKLDVKGSINNISVYNSTTNNDSVLLTGAGAVTLGFQSSVVNNLVINKVEGGSVTLAANTTIGKTFSLLAGSFSTDIRKPYELIAPVSSVFTFGNGTYILGKVRRTNWSNETPVIFNHPNMIVRTRLGSAPTNILVNMIPTDDLPVPERDVKYDYNFLPVSGRNYIADVTFPYSFAGFDNPNENALLPNRYTQATWKPKPIGNIVDTVSDFVRSIGIVSEAFENSRWKLSIPATTSNSNPFDVHAYPVPARNRLNVIITAQQNYRIKISLFDAAGKLCRVVQRDLLQGQNYLDINLAGLSAGKYFLKVQNADNSIRTKAILIY